MSDHLERGRAAFQRRAWTTAREELARAHEAGELERADLWPLALSRHLTGHDTGFVETLEEAHQAHLAAGEVEAAVRCAVWLGLHFAERREIARASGWFGRAKRLLDELGRTCVEHGYLLMPEGQRLLGSGELDACIRAAAEAEALARRFGDADLAALALHMRGRAFLRADRVAEGLSLLDEAMVAVVADDLSPHVAGVVYCSVISACREVWAVRRAQEWTAALRDWCARQPDLVPYTGECRVYRAEILQWRGDWREALDEAGRAREHLAALGDQARSGAAVYQEGEARRLLGELAAAEEAYREASRLGREPQPGLALLRLAQGESKAAAAATRRALSESGQRFQRARLLPAHAEVMLEVGDVEEAERACVELEEIAAVWDVPLLQAMAAQTRGAVELAKGRPDVALPELRRAWNVWRALGAPYHAARSRALLGLACRDLGDEDGARLELEAARAELVRLGATSEAERLSERAGRRAGRGDHGLTPRELEVLARLATGATNRVIGKDLFISEKTVARHVANIFAKLGLSSRAAATAYAYEHDLLDAAG